MKLLLIYSVLFSIVGCSAWQTNENEFEIVVDYQFIPASLLPEAAMPKKNLQITNTAPDDHKIKLIKNKIAQHNRNMDPLLRQVFAPIHTHKRFRIKIILTDGLPDPYDAWTAEFNEKPAVFLNVALWDDQRIERALSAVINHEFTHILMRGMLKEPNRSSPPEVLNYIVVNEGIAHFIGYVRDRKEILESKSKECREAEASLQKAFAELKKATPTRAQEILKNANTGPFWKKFGSISGLCRAAKIYAKEGAAGLTTAIRRSGLEDTL